MTKGDLTRSITVEASGEVAALKNNINEMIRNLKDQTLKNTEQDWLKTNLARFTRMLQGERDLSTVSNLVLSELAPLINAQHGVFYVSDRDDERRAGAEPGRQPTPSTTASTGRQFASVARRADRPVRVREVAHPADQRAQGLHPDLARAWARRRRRTSSSCRPCSKAR